MATRYVSPTGTGVGTYDDPWPWKDAITGVKTVAAGDTIIFKSGTYTDKKAGTPWNKKVEPDGLVGTALNPITIKGEDGGHAILDLFFDVNAGASGTAYVTFRNLHFKDLDAKIDPTTISEGSAPAELADWGTGITLGDAPGCKIIHCVIEGGGQALSAFQSADDAYLYGNVVFDYGWFNDTGATRRAHGHAVYLANATADGTKTVKHNIFGPGYYAASKVGHYGMHYFSTTDRIESIESLGNVAYGGVLLASYDFPEDDITMDECWISSPLVGDSSSYDGNGVAFGYANPKAFTTNYVADANQINFSGSGFSDNHVVTVYTDGTLPTTSPVGQLVAGNTYYVVNEGSGTVELSLTQGGSPIVLTSDGSGNHTMALLSLTGSFVDNKIFHCVLRATNGIWDALTTSGVTIYKTLTDWWSTDAGVTPALQFNEVATFSDVSGGGGTDLVKIDASEYDSDRAHLSIADLDLDGSVDVSTALSTFLDDGDAYQVMHFRDVYGTPVASGTWNGTLSLDIIETVGLDDGVSISSEASPIDSFVVFRVTGGGGGGGGGNGLLSTAARALFASGAAIKPRIFLELEFNTGTERYWNGSYLKTHETYEWQAVPNALVGFSGVESSQDLRANGVTFTLAGIPTDALGGTLAASNYKGRAARMIMALLDPETDEVVWQLDHHFFMDTLDYELNPESITVAIGLETEMRYLARTLVRRYTDQDQKQEFAGDRGLEFIPYLNSGVNVLWGSAGSFFK